MIRAIFTVLILASAAHAQKQYGFDNTKSSGQPYLTPAESLKRMKAADGFEVKLFAAEPMIVNPIAFTIDERGRVWVVESFEYPKRTAPGQMPRDRIVILEDTDGDGAADKRTVFAEGKDFPERFDLASGIEVGYGGIFLGAPPYLWFIENKNDKPGKFEKLLSGFGSQDTHETLNTFQWGPDGWLYGLHGIFTQSEIVSPSGAHPDLSGGRQPPEGFKKTQGADAPRSAVKLNAGMWRYHPRSRKFEVFAEGTSNPWGWDYRNTDGQMILCACVIPHLYHIVPGGIYKRQAGQSLNPYAYGYLNEICDHTFHKESGWAHAGLLSLDTPIVPEQYRDSVIFGSIHGNSLKRNTLKRKGSTFVASRADDFLTSGDKNFRPVNLRWGPNEDIFVSDWHDQNPCHQTKPDDWDYERGRIYRIQKMGTVTKKAEDLAGRSTNELVALANTGTPFEYRNSLRLLAERPTPALSIIKNNEIPKTLRGLWSTAATDPGIFRRVHSTSVRNSMAPAAQSWLLRLGEDWFGGPGVLNELNFAAIFGNEPGVRLQLASLVSRLRAWPTSDVILRTLLKHREDVDDPVIPLMLWWAYEPIIAAKPDIELHWLADNAKENWLITDHILPRAMRRLVATGKPEDLNACIEFVAAVSDAPRRKALEGLAVALQGRQVAAPAAWAALEPKLAADPATQELAHKLAVSFRDPKAGERALATIHNARKSSADRKEAARHLGELQPPTALSVLLSASRQEIDPAVRLECCRALAHFDGPNVSREILLWWKNYTPADRTAMVNVLASKKSWSRDLLAAVAKGDVARTDLNNNVIERMAAFKDADLNADITRIWGKVRDTPAELAKLIDTMRGELDKAPGSFTRGKAVFDAQCAKCHKFDGTGHSVGPALDGAGRDVEYLLANILDPNRVVGQPYFLRRVLLKKGTVEEGLLHEEDGHKIALKGENEAVRVIAKSDIESIDVIERSMMPEGLGSAMTIQDFRDLVRYVMIHPPIQEWQMSGPHDVRPAEEQLARWSWHREQVGVTGRLKLLRNDRPRFVYLSTTVAAEAELTSRLEVQTTAARVRARVNGKDVSLSEPIALRKGENTVRIELEYAGDPGVFSARFLDAERKLRMPEVK